MIERSEITTNNTRFKAPHRNEVITMVTPIQIAKDFTEEIKSGLWLFRIVASGTGYPEMDDRDVTVLCSYESVKNLAMTHRYNSLLFLVDLPTLIAYVYGCLNREFGVPQTVRYNVVVRPLASHVEELWFTVSPYIENETNHPVRGWS